MNSWNTAAEAAPNRRIFDEELEDFVPARVCDVHVHLAPPGGFGPGADFSCGGVPITGYTYEELAADLALALDPEEAVGHARKATELADEEDDLVAAILVLAEAQVACERPAEARAALSELATSAIDEPDMILDVAHAFLNAEDPTTADPTVRAKPRGT